MCGGGASGGNGGSQKDPWAGMREVTTNTTGSRNSGGGSYGQAPAYKPAPTTPVDRTGGQVVSPPPPAPVVQPPVVSPPPVAPPPPPPPPPAPVDTFDADLEAAFGRGIGSAADYFRGRGVSNVDPYMDEITSAAQSRRGNVSRGSDNLDSFFSDIGSDVYGDLTNQLRTSSLDTLNTQIAPTGFDTARIGDTADDEFIDLILGEQFNPIQDYVNRLFSRGTITESGLDAGLAELSNQFGQGNQRLQDIGMGFLNEGRSGARDLADAARGQAGQADLATGFDTAAVGSDLDNYFGDFFSNLEGDLRGAAPTDLFDTSQLSAFAGALGTGAAPILTPPQGFGEEEEEPDPDEEEGSAF